MRNKTLTYSGILAAFCAIFGTVAYAQQQPLSVIDWLERHPDKPPITSADPLGNLEPPVSSANLPPQVTTEPLVRPAPRLVGLVPATVTGLPETLWSGSFLEGLTDQFSDLPPIRLPAAQTLLYTLLLTEARSPGADAVEEDRLTIARVRTLMRLGAPDPVLALLEQVGPDRDPAHFKHYMDAGLLTGQEDTACAILSANPHLAPSLSYRIFCAARRGDWPTAALLFDTGNQLGELPAEDVRALDRFLYPESFEGAEVLPRPDKMSPLLFRLHEAIGEPLTTGTLPRVYAVADLRDLAGWKSQLEAAERLALAGALPANRLLGLYTALQPAASGGVWDRVRAVQRLETALRTRSADAISKTLPDAWQNMQRAGLEVIFSELFAESLQRYQLQGSAAPIAQHMLLLSPEYRQYENLPGADPLLRAIAVGQTNGVVATNPRAEAILSGMNISNARSELIEMARNDRMGEALLRALTLLDDGADGDLRALTQALASLRALGLEDTVRRAALQILVLDRFS